jgi:hypothetical protein
LTAAGTNPATAVLAAGAADELLLELDEDELLLLPHPMTPPAQITANSATNQLLRIRIELLLRVETPVRDGG